MRSLGDAGFDIVHGFDAAQVAPRFALLAGRERHGLLVGNTRALWPAFQAARRDEPDPLDRYTERTLAAAFPGARIYYGHHRYASEPAPLGGDPQYLPLGQLAAAVGLGALAPSHLLIHPVHGPWLALRAVVLLDGDPPATAPLAAPPCACCFGADPACTVALARALTSTDWRDWLAVRDACQLRADRYSDEQLAFHYAELARQLAG
ncbi:MAG TPA: hypothetical protein VGC42_25975 [Kofleriaceae bacterium]